MRTQSLLRHWTLGVLLASLLALTAAFAGVVVPTLKHRVNDLTATLSDQQQAALENRLAAFEQEKGSQIAVLIVPSTQPEDIAQYSIRVVEQWQLGRKSVDDGVLMLIAKNDRATRIEVGYGLEGVIPDAIAKRIIEEIMIPRFRKNDFAGGINEGVDRLIGLINGEPLPEPKSTGTASRSNSGFNNDFAPVFVVLAAVVGFKLRAILGKLLGGLVNGCLVALAIWFLGEGGALAGLAGVFAFVITQLGFDVGSGSSHSGRSNGGRRSHQDGGRSYRNKRSYRGGGTSNGDEFSWFSVVRGILMVLSRAGNSRGPRSGGGFSGGGGGFGGGGASGSW